MVNDSEIAAFRIGTRWIGLGHPCFVIAEAGVNHNGDPILAKEMIDAAASSGADAVKFQTFRTERVVSELTPKAAYQEATTNGRGGMFEMVKKLELPPEVTRELYYYSQERGILFLSSPFDDDSVELLEGLGVSAFKVGSGELTNHLLLSRIASTGKPILLSTGMASLDEIAESVDLIRRCPGGPLALFHCVSNYPADPRDCNLAAMETIAERFGVPVGWSDHTLGSHVAIASVAMGARLLEKHFTLDRKLPGPDHHSSLEPVGLAEMIRCIREVESAIGDGEKRIRPSELNVASVARRSLFTSRDLKRGHRLVQSDLTALRPGTGIPVNHVQRVLGRRTKRDIPANVMLVESDLI